MLKELMFNYGTRGLIMVFLGLFIFLMLVYGFMGKINRLKFEIFYLKNKDKFELTKALIGLIIMDILFLIRYY